MDLSPWAIGRRLKARSRCLSVGPWWWRLSRSRLTRRHDERYLFNNDKYTVLSNDLPNNNWVLLAHCITNTAIFFQHSNLFLKVPKSLFDTIFLSVYFLAALSLRNELSISSSFIYDLQSCSPYQAETIQSFRIPCNQLSFPMYSHIRYTTSLRTVQLFW